MRSHSYNLPALYKTNKTVSGHLRNRTYSRFCCLYFSLNIWRNVKISDKYVENYLMPTIKHGVGSEVLWECL